MVEITEDEVNAALRNMKKGKATGIDEVRVEMVLAAANVGVSWTWRLRNAWMAEGKIPKECRTGLIIPLWKRKGDVQDPSKCRGITLLSQVFKLLERVLDVMIRKRVECEIGEEQQGFRKGRGTTEVVFILRQQVEKRPEVQESIALGFIDLENAYDTVLRVMVMAVLRWMEVPETDVRMVEGMYARTTGRVVIGAGVSDEFGINIGLIHDSALSPLLFSIVLELISRKGDDERRTEKATICRRSCNSV